MLKTNRENPGGGARFSGRGNFAPAPYTPDNSQYDPTNYATESAARFGGQGADDSTADLMGSIYDLSGAKPTGLSQIKKPSGNEGITAAPPVLAAPPAPAPVLSSPSGMAGIGGGSGGGVNGSMGTYGNGQMINGIPQFSVGYMSGAPAPGAGTKVRL